MSHSLPNRYELFVVAFKVGLGVDERDALIGLRCQRVIQSRRNQLLIVDLGNDLKVDFEAQV